MDFCFRSGDPDGYGYAAGTNWLYRSDFRELNLLLFHGHLEQLPLLFVVGLLTDSILPAPGFDTLAATATLRDPSGP